MSSTLAPPFLDWPRIPYIGVGCLVERQGKLLLVLDHRGLWSTPGGHLDFGESPAACAARETMEEAGVEVTNVQFVAITNDVLDDIGKHYVTIWMRGEAAHSGISIKDVAEIAEAGWFAPQELPQPLHAFFENLMAGRCMPSSPDSVPESLRLAAELAQVHPDSSSEQRDEVLVVLTKEQASAMADTMTAPAEAKRRDQAESRFALKSRWLPELKDFPAADRVAALGAAQNHMGRCWVLYVPIFITAVWQLYPFLAGNLSGLPDLPKAPAGLVGIALGATMLIGRSLMRSCLRRMLSHSRENGFDHDSSVR